MRVIAWRLKFQGRLTRGGIAYALFFALLASFVAHCAFIRYHEFFGLQQAAALHGPVGERASRPRADRAYPHLTAADRWGLVRNERLVRALGHVSLDLQRFEEAETHARRVLDRLPADADTRLLLAQALAGQRRSADAEHQFRTVLDLAQPGAWVLAPAHLGLGSALVARGDFLAAASELRTAVEIAPDLAAAHAELGGALAELGQLDEAVEQLQHALRLDPALAGAHYNLGTLLAHRGRFQDAVSCYRRALELAPDEAQTHNNLGFALLNIGDLDRAKAHLERAVALDARCADAHYNLGVLLAEQNEHEQAAEHFRTAARLDARYAEVLRDSVP